MTRTRVAISLLLFGIALVCFGGELRNVLPISAPVEVAEKATAATYIYEKDKHSVPSAVMAGLNRLNREKKIVATLFERDTTNGKQSVPKQYQASAKAVPFEDMPALVVTAGDKVLNIVKSPTTVEQVVEAVR